MRVQAISRATVLLLVILVVTLGVGADAKKRRKKHAKKRSSGGGYSRPSPRPAPAPSPRWSQPPAAASAPEPPSVVEQANKQITSVKEQAQKIVDGYTTENKALVEKHNTLVGAYNSIVKNHQDLIKKYNTLVDELQDPSLASFLAAKAIQASHHPGIEGAVNKTKIHVLPIAQETLLKTQVSGAEWFNKTQSSVQNFFETYGGETLQGQEWVPMMSGFIVYGSVAIPIVVACWCVLEFVCKLQQLILFGHVYLAVSGMILAGIAISTDADPLSTFAEQDPHLYQFSQVAFALSFVAYGAVAMFSYCCTGHNANWRFVNIIVIILFGAGYYLLIWTPAMTDEAPKVDDFVESLYMPEPPGAQTNAKAADDVPALLTASPYVVIAIIFGILFVFESSPAKERRRGSSSVSPEEDPENKGD